MIVEEIFTNEKEETEDCVISNSRFYKIMFRAARGRRPITAMSTDHIHDWMTMKLLILWLRYKWSFQSQSKELRHVFPLTYLWNGLSLVDLLKKKHSHWFLFSASYIWLCLFVVNFYFNCVIFKWVNLSYKLHLRFFSVLQSEPITSSVIISRLLLISLI